MGWDGMGGEIFENRPILWDEKISPSHPMGWFLTSHPIPRGALSHTHNKKKFFNVFSVYFKIFYFLHTFHFSVHTIDRESNFV